MSIHSVGGGAFGYDVNHSWGLWADGGQAYGIISSFDADGFTYTKSKNSSPTGTAFITYLALR